jgi:hyperosmotically inducible protein
MKRLAAALLAAGLPCVAGCTNAPSTNAPGPTATQVKQAAGDALLVAEIKGKLLGVDPNSATSVGVSVHDGVATLTGTLRTAEARSKAVATARGVDGIHEVRDQLRVDPKAPTVGQQVGDAALAARITAALLMQTGSTAVNVSVRDGVATLTGTVPPNVRDVALATARNTKGVHVVVDKLKVSNP